MFFFHAGMSVPHPSRALTFSALASSDCAFFAQFAFAQP